MSNGRVTSGDVRLGRRQSDSPSRNCDREMLRREASEPAVQTCLASPMPAAIGESGSNEILGEV